MKANPIDLLSAIPYIRHFSLVDSIKDKCCTPWRILYDFEMIFILDGELIVREKGKEPYFLKKYDMHIMPPNVWHIRSLSENGNCRYYNVHFEFIDQNTVLPALNVNNVYIKPILKGVKVAKIDEVLNQRSYCVLKNVEIPRKTRVANPQDVIYCFKTMSDNIERINVFAEYRTRGIFSYLIAFVLEEAQKNDVGYSIDWVIEKFKDICTRSTSKINVALFAQQYGYSYVYFRNKFKEKVGVAPGAYAQNERLLLSLRYLESKYFSVSEIADMVGFENVYHFSSVFKKRFGKSPTFFLGNRKNKESEE